MARQKLYPGIKREVVPRALMMTTSVIEIRPREELRWVVRLIGYGRQTLDLKRHDLSHDAIGFGTTLIIAHRQARMALARQSNEAAAKDQVKVAAMADKIRNIKVDKYPTVERPRGLDRPNDY